MRLIQAATPAKRWIAFECEGWAIDRREGKTVPVDVTPILKRLDVVNGTPLTGKFFRESGLGSIELAGHHAETIEGAVSNVLQMHRRAMKERLDIHFGCHSPYDGSGHIVDTLETDKSRFRAIVQAAQLETARIGGHPDDWKALLKQNYFAATHAHLSFAGMPVTKDAVDHRLISATNVINNIAPRIARIFCRKYDLDNTGHLGIFAKWAAPERFPYYGLWFRSFEHMRQYFAGITRFIHCVDGDKENGAWEPDLQTRMQWGVHDVADLGIWHLCRLRTRFGTMEVRILPSVPLEILELVMRDLDDLVRFLVSIAEPGDCDCDNFADFMTKRVWREEITRFAIANVDTVPLTYTREMWTRDFRH